MKVNVVEFVKDIPCVVNMSDLAFVHVSELKTIDLLTSTGDIVVVSLLVDIAVIFVPICNDFTLLNSITCHDNRLPVYELTFAVFNVIVCESFSSIENKLMSSDPVGADTSISTTVFVVSTLFIAIS